MMRRGIGVQPLERLVVLLVDDSDDEREMYAEYLNACGFQILQAANVDDGLGLALQYLPAAVVTDIAMPGQDGFSFVLRLKHNRHTRNIPVIVVTGHVFPAHRDSGRRAGCDAYLAKPCAPDELKQAIVGVVKRLKKAQSAVVRERSLDRVRG